MRYRFTKMQSLGNDFVVLDGVAEQLTVTAAGARRLADRHFGVGCDQVLLVQPGGGQAAGEFLFTIFNQDGGEAEQCGNGARCLARFLRDAGHAGDAIRARVRANRGALMTLTMNADDSVSVTLGAPEFRPARIPFVADAAQTTYALDLPGGDAVEVSALAIGNPHAVLRVDDIATAAVAALGPALENHPRFPARANVGFMRIAARDHIELRVHERGVGETHGCGSGACAAVAAGIELGLLDNHVRVSLPGGDAEVQWTGRGRPIILRGPATRVFDGEIDLGDGDGDDNSARLTERGCGGVELGDGGGVELGDGGDAGGDASAATAD